MAENILINGPLKPDIISARVGLMGERTDLGGHSIFLGQVRADISGIKKVKAIEYSAYEEMAGKEAERIKKDILEEFNDVKSVEILHSVGVVMAGEISLMVMVSAGHRHHAITACARVVELIKEKMPVWKKEIFEDDTHQWKQNNLA